jgi:hypothetical protein
MAPRPTLREDGTKQCTKCGVVVPVSGFYTTGRKKDGSPKYNSWCKACSKQKAASYHISTWGPERLQFSAYKRTQSVRAFLSYLLAKARRRHTCLVTINDLEETWVAQQGRCALTGWEMTMRLGEGQVPTNASIDRIDSKLGYLMGNVQLVCRAVNVAKSDLPQQEFFRLCAAVAETQDAHSKNTRLAA